jgi:hypothetical protein
VYRANATILANVHSRLFTRRGTQDEFKSCLELVTSATEGDITDKVARYCFGMSKMTVRDEAANQKEYFKLKYVEFLEYIGRVAHYRYQDEPDIDLAQKIERILD